MQRSCGVMHGSSDSMVSSVHTHTHTHTHVLTQWKLANASLCTAPPQCRAKYTGCSTATHGSPLLIVHPLPPPRGCSMSFRVSPSG